MPHRCPTPASVLIFDSGVGGLTILQEIAQLQPTPELHYLMDCEALPYGTKDDERLSARMQTLLAQAVAELQPDLLVIACNTASTLALTELRALLPIPVVGVVPAIKVAAGIKGTGNIGLLATPATINRPYTDGLVRDFAQGQRVFRRGSHQLVSWAESLLQQPTQPIAQRPIAQRPTTQRPTTQRPTTQQSEQPTAEQPLQAELFQYLNDWLVEHHIDRVVLGCTHFPIFRPLLETLWPHIQWLDSGAAIARRVANLLNAVYAPEPSLIENGKVEIHYTGEQQCHLNASLNYLQRILPAGFAIHPGQCVKLPKAHSI